MNQEQLQKVTATIVTVVFGLGLLVNIVMGCKSNVPGLITAFLAGRGAGMLAIKLREWMMAEPKK